MLPLMLFSNGQKWKWQFLATHSNISTHKASASKPISAKWALCRPKWLMVAVAIVARDKWKWKSAEWKVPAIGHGGG